MGHFVKVISSISFVSFVLFFWAFNSYRYWWMRPWSWRMFNKFDLYKYSWQLLLLLSKWAFGYWWPMHRFFNSNHFHYKFRQLFIKFFSKKQTGTNECLGQLGGHNCSEDGYCTDQSNGFSCNCNSGFLGDGVNCTGISFYSFFLPFLSSFIYFWNF